MNKHDSWDIVSGVGITALGVAGARAMESKRSDALIDDPYAESFVTRAHSSIPLPTSWASVEGAEQRSEGEALWASFWAGMATYVGVRSRFFDEYLLDASQAGIRQVVILAAGLDTRAFRLPWPAAVQLYEIDQPKVLEFKDTVLRDQSAVSSCARHVVPVDLRDDWPVALLRAGLDPQSPTAWLAEGLLPYLPGSAAEALFAHVHRCSVAGSRLGVEEVHPDMRATIHQPDSQDLKRSSGVDVAALWPNDDRPDPAHWFRDHGWQVTATSGGQAADRYGRTLGKPADTDFATLMLLTAQLA